MQTGFPLSVGCGTVAGAGNPDTSSGKRRDRRTDIRGNRKMSQKDQRKEKVNRPQIQTIPRTQYVVSVV